MALTFFLLFLKAGFRGSRADFCSRQKEGLNGDFQGYLHGMLTCGIVTFLMVPYWFLTFRVGIVRMAFVTSCLLLGLVLLATPVLGANIDAFARVNLVQGMEATVGAPGQGAELQHNPSDADWFNLSGPADYCVDVQVSVLESPFSSVDEASFGAFNLDTHHDQHGNFKMPLPLDAQADENPATNPPHYIVTLTYE